jgi:hypothetical protein
VRLSPDVVPTGTPCEASVVAPLNGSQDPADNKAFLNNVWQRQTTAAMSLETAVATSTSSARRAMPALVLCYPLFFSSVYHTFYTRLTCY